MAVGSGRRSAFRVAALRGAASAGDRGEMERRVRGFHPRAHLGLGRLGEAGPLGPAAASGGALGGGAARLGRGIGAAVLCWSTGGAASVEQRDGSGSDERHGEHPGTWSALGRGARAACGGSREQGEKKGEGGRKRKEEKEKGKKKKKRKRRGRKKKRGPGEIRGDGREPVAASTRSDVHEKRGE